MAVDHEHDWADVGVVDGLGAWWKENGDAGGSPKITVSRCTVDGCRVWKQETVWPEEQHWPHDGRGYDHKQTEIRE